MITISSRVTAMMLIFGIDNEADRFLTSVGMSKITGSSVDPNRSKVTVGVLADQWLEAKLDLACRAYAKPRDAT